MAFTFPNGYQYIPGIAFDEALQNILGPSASGTLNIGSQDFSKATGDTIGFQVKPNQIVATTGEVYGAQFQPRVASGIAALSVIGLHAEATVKGSGAGTVGNLRGMQVQLTDDNAGTRTISNATLIRLWHQLAGTHTFTNGIVALELVAAGGGANWTSFAILPEVTGVMESVDTGTSGTKKGGIKVMFGATARYIRLYDAIG